MFSVPLALLMHALDHPLVFLCPAQKTDFHNVYHNTGNREQKKNLQKKHMK